MKTHLFFKAFLTVAMIMIVSISIAQVPKSFSYQAVVRNGSGSPITNKAIGIRITLQDQTGTAYYKETHMPTSTDLGIITINIGGGTPVDPYLFSNVPWETGVVYLNIEIDPNGGTAYTQMGIPTQLQSVPFALYADSGKEIVSDPNALDDDPIFVVKNKAGQIVFAVYQGGVRVFVEDNQIKGVRGGFAIGGLTNQSKGQQEYFRITPDSARLYVKENPTAKGVRGGFAIGGLTNQSKGVSSRNLMFIAPDSARIYIDDSNIPKGTRGGFAISGMKSNLTGISTNFFNIETKNSYIINPSQPRLLWYPLKNAFLVGQVYIPHPDSVGVNSFSSGYESMAKGAFSQAMGYKAIAKGVNSTAIGIQAIASKVNSFALGEAAKALGNNSFAFGTGSEASGPGSFAFGSVGRDTTGNILTSLNTTASGANAFAIGLGAKATSLNSFSIGTSSTAIGQNSTALGYYSNAIGDYSLAINGGSALGKNAMAFRGIASGDNSIAFGPNSKATGTYSFALGGGKWAATTVGKTYTEANGNYSYAMGYNSAANGNYSFAMGGGSTTLADYTFALGYGLTNNSFKSFVIGQYNEPLGAVSNVWNDVDPLFIVANGTAILNPDLVITPSNALTIYKNGNTMLKGNFYPTLDNSYDLGTATNAWKNVICHNITPLSDARLKDRISPLSYGLADILKLKPVSFIWKNSSDQNLNLGFIAQDVKLVMKELVAESNDPLKTLTLNYNGIIPVLVKAIQEQQKLIDDLKQENELLRAKVDQIDALKAEFKKFKLESK